MANLVRSRKARTGKGRVGSSRKGEARLAARPAKRRVRRDWDSRGARPIRFARLRAALNILEKRADGHHVVYYDPLEREPEGATRRAQRRSPRGRDGPHQTRGRRVVHEGEGDLEEVVRTSRRRAMKTEAMAEGEVDKIQIEVGAVKALNARHGVMRGMFWVTLLSVLLWWIPVLGPAVAGYVGGRKAGTPLRAAIAAIVPITIMFTTLTAIASSTSTVPAMVRHLVQAGTSGVLGSLPFDFPIIEYVFGNLAAILTSGPNALFSLLAFALAGGAMTQMKIQERMVPPITARLPASRVVSPMVQAPGRALTSKHQAEVDELMARMNEVLASAEGERRAMNRVRSHGASAEPWSPERSRRGWLHLRRLGKVPRYAPLQGEDDGEPRGALDAGGRQVVADFLAKTPPAKGGRLPRSLKAPEVEFDLPQTIAFAGPSHSVGAEGRTGAHQYRPSKLYHIYGGSVNPVARAKLEKRLRRTHTLHTMRRGARSLAEMIEVAPDGRAAHPFIEEEPTDKPRSLESSALATTMHYDALEHLENASLEAPRKHVPKPKAGEDDLGGVIAHLGEGGEAFVDERAVEDAEITGSPVFDRRGRQRARIAVEPAPPVTVAAKVHAPAVAKPRAPSTVREAVEAVAHESGGGSLPGKSKVAQSADRAHMTAAQEEKVNRWLKRTIESAEGHAPMPAPKAKQAEPEQRAAEPVAEKKSPPRRPKTDSTPTAFDITHGSTEVDAEASVSEEDSPSPRKNRSASDILREIRLQKKAEKDAEPGEEVARTAKRAKVEADEIERHAREGAGEVAMAEVSLAAHEEPKQAPAKPAKRRPHGEDLEEVESEAEKLSSDLELTLAPIREEGVSIVEVDEEPVEAAAPHAAAEAIPVVGESHGVVAISEVGASPPEMSETRGGEPERDVKPGDVVLAGPSTDGAGADAAEAELSPLDQERIRKRLQEGWNRL